MATNYMIDFSMVVGVTRTITADSEEQALKIADALLRDRKFENDLYESARECMAYSDWENPQVIDCGDELLVEFDDEDFQECFGIDMKALREEN